MKIKKTWSLFNAYSRHAGTQHWIGLNVDFDIGLNYYQDTILMVIIWPFQSDHFLPFGHNVSTGNGHIMTINMAIIGIKMKPSQKYRSTTKTAWKNVSLVKSYGPIKIQYQIMVISFVFLPLYSIKMAILGEALPIILQS